MERDPVLGGLFEDAVHRIDVPVGELVAGSMRLGRRQRLHRRLRIAGTSLVVAALATTGAATQWSSGEGDARRTVASGATSVFPERPAPSPPREQVTPEAMLQILVEMLPSGGQLTEFVPESGHPAAFSVVYDDGNGASELTVGMQPQRDPNPDLSCDGYRGLQAPGTPPPSCTTRELPDGTKLQTLTGGDGRTALYGITVHAYRPDGVRVWISAANGKTGYKGGVTRPKPPLGVLRLEAMAADPAWQLTVEHATAEEGRALVDRRLARPATPAPHD
ncbi:hypothetical protein F4556_005374 [Kitasatospora gansuensis]|uniref:Uncharacterized protein n=1 Tax=Kitasatospora gansuensis TaxID=258050 RepID=A0A7W7SG58_9ACTN|nr:hypothetical protein [Kitasatospora gansuensis]MBB4949839.1 hypothetical protein [Kitasatospora gansuensis]